MTATVQENQEDVPCHSLRVDVYSTRTQKKQFNELGGTRADATMLELGDQRNRRNLKCPSKLILTATSLSVWAQRGGSMQRWGQSMLQCIYCAL